jgi:CheY-like chemotaxis protein
MHNILLVEDNLHNVRLMEQLIEDISEEIDNHIHLVKAYTGMEALDKAEEVKYDLVLMDISLPDMDGITTMKNLRKLNSFTNVPIIAATAHAMACDEELFRGIFDDYIVKPIDDEVFTEIVKKWLGKVNV